MPKMALKQLLSPWVDPTSLPDLVVESISNQSQLIEEHALFLAYKNELCDRLDFVAEAIERGAVAIAMDAQRNQCETLIAEYPEVVWIPVPHLAQEYGNIAAHFYGDPTKTMTVIGVTGTNGKSSTAYFITQALNYLNKACAFIGTIGIGLPDCLQESALTSLDPITFQQLAAQFREKGVNALAIEMSSHALDQNRLSGVHVDTIALTQVTSDHLDYHQTLEGYHAAKEKSMQLPGLNYAVLNLNDAEGYRWFETYHQQVDIIGYGTKVLAADMIQALKYYLWIEAVCLDDAGLNIFLNDQQESFVISVQLIGRFNVENIVATVATLKAHGYSIKQIQAAVKAMHGAPGRMQLFGGDDFPAIYVDYAHTTDGLQKALQAVREHSDRRLTVIFGCGGDRDKTKRAPMGAIAAQLSDHIIITSDNPRSEDPMQIVKQIKQGIIDEGFDLKNLTVECDRKKAIQSAIMQASANDVLLIAGKGHENTQKMDGYTIDCDDRAIVQAALEQLKVKDDIV